MYRYVACYHSHRLPNLVIIQYSQKYSHIARFQINKLSLLNAGQGNLVAKISSNVMFLWVQLSRIAREVQQLHEPRGEPAKVARIVGV
jgi:hypothetical protein